LTEVRDRLCGVPEVGATRPRHRRTGYFVAGGLFEGLASFGDLEARIAALPTQQDRGDAFEVFAEAYLATQKLVGAEQVWPADQVPVAVLQACSLPVRDLGADGVYKTWAGQYNAYQSKFRTDRPALTWQELSTFMGLTDQVGERILFTNCDDLPAVMDARSGFCCIRGTDLERLTKDDLEAIAEWLRGAAFTPKRKAPRPHQAEALEAILAGLEEHDRVTAVMACATGKTLVSLWLAEHRNAKRILVLGPSLALIRQTLHEWLKETEWEQPRFIAVCSDPTVTQGVEDALIVHQRDLDFPVTTDVGEVRKFLGAAGDGVQIVFSTYQSAHVVGEASRGMNSFDLGIFDEAHKTTGREGAKFGFALDDRHVKIAKRVFLTATPRHYDVRKKDKEGDKALVYSMDVPAIYGPVVHTLSFAEAARRGIICSYKVIISVVASDMINADLLSKGEVIVEGDVVRARTVANQIAIQKACEEHDLKKVFSFHRNVASARDFTGDTASSITAHLPDFEAYHVNGGMRTARREKEMRAFREAHRAIMSNARCLTEGVDVPAVDIVAFLSPRKSKVDIVQAAGRAMRMAPGKERGYVLLPLFLETQENETLEDALERTDFEEAWDVLQAMQEQDAVLAEIIREMREEKGRLGGFDDSRLRERVEVLGPDVSLDVLRSAISTTLVDRLGGTWDERFGELRGYKERFGDCNVPPSWAENQQLAKWVQHQRSFARHSVLSTERIRRLREVGFSFEPYETAWLDQFENLRLYAAGENHSRVPSRYHDRNLARWVVKQRVAYRAHRLADWKKEMLLTLNFEFERRDFDRRNKKYMTFKQARLFMRSLGFKSLSDYFLWARGKELKNGKFPGDLPRSPQHVYRGKGWTNWNDFLGTATRAVKDQEAWEENFQKYRNYVGRQGAREAGRKRAGITLSNWVNTQRDYQRKQQLEPDHKRRLDEVGFSWNPQCDTWETMFAELQRYKGEHGGCNVPQGWVKNPPLGKWVSRQRVLKKSGKLSSARKKRLDALGFEWRSPSLQGRG
jgi:superfamily II DNA or RNA helicase